MPTTHNQKYSICTIVSKWDEYARLVSSLKSHGFNESNSELLTVDNSCKNVFDAYEAIRFFIQISNYDLIVLVHQDVLFEKKGYNELCNTINCITEIDSNWAILSNAGKSSDPLKCHIAVADGKREWHTKEFPSVVDSVDEHFIVLRKSTGVTVSRDLGGFHFYGTELCQVANRLGYKCYAIDFLIIHPSHGNIDEEFFNSKLKIELKYKKLRKNKRIPTMCTNISVDPTYFNKTISDLYSYAVVVNSPYHFNARNILKNNSRHTTIIARLIIKSGLLELKYALKIFFRRIKGDVMWWAANWKSRIHSKK
jgi:hypothetical protein